MAEIIEALVDGGNATPGPPLGPVLGPLGINIMDVVKVINEKTKAFEGMKVPVKVIVDTATQEFEITVGTPPTSALILKELKLEKGSSNPRADKVGDLSMEQVKKMYNVVLLTKAYYTNNKKLADESYKKLKKYRKINYILMYYGTKIHLIKPFIEILRRLRNAYYILTVFINKMLIQS